MKNQSWLREEIFEVKIIIPITLHLRILDSLFPVNIKEKFVQAWWEKMLNLLPF